MTVSQITTAEITIQLDPEDFVSTTESDLIEQATMHVYDFASGVGADVTAEVLTVAYRHNCIQVEVSGHYTEVGAFSRAWNEE